MIREALDKLDKKTLKKKLVEAGFKSGSIDMAFSRGVIPMKMVPAMEELTAISAKFWGFPDNYEPNGDRIKAKIVFWQCKHCGENDAPKCHKCVREDGKLVSDELATD